MFAPTCSAPVAERRISPRPPAAIGARIDRSPAVPMTTSLPPVVMPAIPSTVPIDSPPAASLKYTSPPARTARWSASIETGTPTLPTDCAGVDRQPLDQQRVQRIGGDQRVGGPEPQRRHAHRRHRVAQENGSGAGRADLEHAGGGKRPEFAGRDAQPTGRVGAQVDRAAVASRCQRQPSAAGVDPPGRRRIDRQIIRPKHHDPAARVDPPGTGKPQHARVARAGASSRSGRRSWRSLR